MPMDHFNLPPAAEFLLRVFPAPHLGCPSGKMLWKAQLSIPQSIRKEARQRESEQGREKEMEKGLDFERLESQKKEKAKSVTLI